MIRRVALCALVLCGCPYDFSIPDGGRVACATNEECPAGVCDLELGICVGAVVRAPSVVLEVEPRQGPRATLFRFNAGKSTDPAQGTLSYAWRIEGESWDGGAFPYMTGTEPVFLRRFDVPRDEFCPGADCDDVVRTVHLQVVSSSGKTAETTASVIVRNNPPVADFGDDLFVGKEVSSVTLDVCGGMNPNLGCTAYDPDQSAGGNDAGEPITFSDWKQVSGVPVPLTQVDGHHAHFQPPPAWTRPLVFESIMSDGVVERRGRVRVYRSSYAWVGINVGASVFRVHPDFLLTEQFRGSDGGLSGFYSPDTVVAASDGYWFGDGTYFGQGIGGPAAIVHLDRSLNELERFEAPGLGSDSTIPSLVPPTATAPGCAVLRPFSTDAGAVDEAATAFIRFGNGVGMLDRTYAPPRETPRRVHPAGPTGDCWTIGSKNVFPPDSGEIGRFDVAGNWQRVDSYAFLPEVSAAGADGTLWVAERIPLRPPDGGEYPPVFFNFGFARTVLHRYPLQGPSAAFDMDGGFYRAIESDGVGGLWASDFRTRELLHIDALGRAAPISALRTRASSIAWDPVERALWVTDRDDGSLRRLVERGDAGFFVDHELSREELPLSSGQFRLGFEATQLSIDPATGSAVTFIGSSPQAYLKWVTVPSHFRRVIHVPFSDPNISELGADPSSGRAWAADSDVMRYVDASGRVLQQIPHGFSGRLPISKPNLTVDRDGTAWVGTFSGADEVLQAFGVDGALGRKIKVPALPIALQRSGDRVCAAGADGGAWRVDLTAGTPQILSIPGGLTAQHCSPGPNGGAWVLAVPRDAGVNPVFVDEAFRFDPGAATPSLQFLVPSERAGDSLFVTDLRFEPFTGGFWATTWLGSYYSSLRYFEQNGAEKFQLPLQDFSGNLLGIGQRIGLLQVCPTPSLACREIRIADRVAKLQRYDTRGTVVDKVLFGVGTEASRFDLVP